MPQEDGAEYFMRRAREERERAENAPGPASYRSHLELARLYEQRAVQQGRGHPARCRAREAL